MLIVLVAATDVLGMEVVSNLVSSAIAYIPNLIAAIIILILGAILADVLKGFTVVTCRSLGIPAADMIGSIIFWFVFISIMISALSQAQLETDFIIANLSILLGALAFAFALAYGLAARPLLGGFLAQFYNRGKVNPGDRIRIENHEGIVLAIDRASFTLDVDGRLLIIPLSKLQTESILVLERAAGGETYIESKSRS
jgi:small-conductance mechanosensitive channel